MYDFEKMEKAATLFIEAVGDDPKRPGLIETPKRVAKFYSQVLNGYDLDAKDHLKVFKEKTRNMVIVRDIPVYSFCEHHIALFHGKISIAYIPDGEVLGLSKLVRIARVFAKKLQIQERLTDEIATFISENVKNLGVAVRIEAEHTCMSIRGVRAQGTTTVTNRLKGAFLENPEVRSEFLSGLR